MSQSKTKSMKTLRVAAYAVVFASAAAWAQPAKTAADYFKVGETEYNLGNFDKAVEAFKKGFGLETNDKNKSAYLYGIAQSYRQARDCPQALFFYKRFLALRGADIGAQLKQDVEDRMKELEDCVAQQNSIANKPPVTTPATQDPATGKQVATGGDGGDDEEENGGTVAQTTVTGGAPRLISVRAFGGGARITAADLDVPVQATAALVAGYPLAVAPQVTLDLGAGFTFTPVPFDNMAEESKSASLLGLIANVGATYQVAPKIGIRGDLGAGLLIFSGISESPFTGFAPVSGAISMPHVRVGLSADYAITPNIVATVAPITFSYSPGKDGLQTPEGDKIGSITAIDFMVGLGYRM